MSVVTLDLFLGVIVSFELESGPYQHRAVPVLRNVLTLSPQTFKHIRYCGIARCCLQLHKTIEIREEAVEGLSQELRANKTEVNRLQPLETRNLDLVGELKQMRADKDR